MKKKQGLAGMAALFFLGLLAGCTMTMTTDPPPPPEDENEFEDTVEMVEDYASTGSDAEETLAEIYGEVELTSDEDNEVFNPDDVQGHSASLPPPAARGRLHQRPPRGGNKGTPFDGHKPGAIVASGQRNAGAPGPAGPGRAGRSAGSGAKAAGSARSSGGQQASGGRGQGGSAAAGRSGSGAVAIPAAGGPSFGGGSGRGGGPGHGGGPGGGGGRGGGGHR